MSEQDFEKQISEDSYRHNDVQQVATSGANNEFIHIGNQKFRRSELAEAFGGTLNPGLTAPSVHKFANPAPLGLSAFALTTFVLSLINAHAMGVTTPNVVVGAAFFYGGFIQMLAGMWEMAIENTFGALALSSYGGFWMSWGVINTPWFGVAEAYGDNARDFEVGVGFFLLGWAIFTIMLTVCTLKSTVTFCGMFAILSLTFVMLAVGHLAPSVNCNRAGGVLGVVCAFFAWYNAYAGVATKQNSYLTVTALHLPGSDHYKKRN